jgi:hypothetical protein
MKLDKDLNDVFLLIIEQSKPVPTWKKVLNKIGDMIPTVFVWTAVLLWTFNNTHMIGL